MARGKRAKEKKRAKALRRRKQSERNRHQPASVFRLSGRQLDQLREAYELIDDGQFSQAEEVLSNLLRKGVNHPAVVEALVVVYQERGDHSNCATAAYRLMRLTPEEAEPHLMFAQESAHCGRAGTALVYYREFIERWPDHRHVEKALLAIEILQEEVASRIEENGWPDEHALDWMLLHEESLRLLGDNDFEACAAKCRQLIKHNPDFASVRNNLATALFQSGQTEQAIDALEETLEKFPDNNFAKATLARYYYLSGRFDESQPLVDDLLAWPPTHVDPVLATMEVLALVGCDEDLEHIAEQAVRQMDADPQAHAIMRHYLAYAQCRLGKTAAARGNWEACLEILPGFDDAEDNLEDLQDGVGHAPWHASLNKWLPRNLIDRMHNSVSREGPTALGAFPQVPALVPALLDRGDPPGRELAVNVAKAIQSPDMLDALKEFALSPRGPDGMRLDVLQFLKGRGAIDSGPLQIYCDGQRREVELGDLNITGEPVNSFSSRRVQKLAEAGAEAMADGELDRAETLFQQALIEEPDNATLGYNLCLVWIRRDGDEGYRRARARMEEIYQRSPDHFFVTVGMAQFAFDEGDLSRARELLAPLDRCKELHVSQAKALNALHVRIALVEGEYSRARRRLDFLCDLVGSDDPVVQHLTDQLETESSLERYASPYHR